MLGTAAHAVHWPHTLFHSVKAGGADPQTNSKLSDLLKQARVSSAECYIRQMRPADGRAAGYFPVAIVRTAGSRQGIKRLCRLPHS